MLAWIGCVKNISFMLEYISVVITDEDHILALTMGLNAMYDFPGLYPNNRPHLQLCVDNMLPF
jgi:hypothetical protein